MSKRMTLIGSLVFAALVLGACQGLPPMQLIVVISPTPDPNVIMITVTPREGGAEPTAEPVVATPGPPELPTLTPTVEPALQGTPTLAPTPTLSAFPTETRAEIYIAQQDFQNGYMFWLSSARPPVIWVLITSTSNPNAGEWRIYRDTFVEGEPEFDPDLVPPDGLFQPRRGFGKLWRTTPGLREAMGWATTPEFDLNTPYVYQPGGMLDVNGNYVPGPGRHFLTTLGRQTFALYESVDGFGRWERVN